jgi:hypothetical protein
LDLKNVKLQFLPPSTTNCKVATTWSEETFK